MTKKKERSVSEIDTDIESTKTKLANLRTERAEAQQRELRQASENMLLAFKEAFDTEDKEMSLEDLTSFVNSKIAKAKAKQSYGVQGFAYEETKESDASNTAQDESQSDEQTDVENNSYN